MWSFRETVVWFSFLAKRMYVVCFVQKPLVFVLTLSLYKRCFIIQSLKRAHSLFSFKYPHKLCCKKISANFRNWIVLIHNGSFLWNIDDLIQLAGNATIKFCFKNQSITRYNLLENYFRSKSHLYCTYPLLQVTTSFHYSYHNILNCKCIWPF